MKSPEEQQAFFQEHWPALLAAAEEGPDAVEAVVAAFDDPLERRILYFFSRPGLVFEDWKGKNLDTIIGVARHGIREFLAQAEAATDEETALRLTDLANVMSYNLAADLADCWEDGLERGTPHFEAGLAAADDCVRWRDNLGKGAGPKSMAWWAKGMHELSLGLTDAAEASWRRSLEYAEEAADADDEFGVVLGRGYVGLAEWVGGQAEGRARWQAACDTFREQMKDEAKKGDAQVGLDQLETAGKRYAAQA